MAIEICDICGEKVEVNGSQNVPNNCPACFNKWTPMHKEQEQPGLNVVQNKQAGGVSDLTFICQKSGKGIPIPSGTSVVLGREAHGSEVLIQTQISRKHCLVEWNEKDGFLISDMGSTHGTYLGVNRIDCSLNPKQPLNNGEILFLGREIYAVKLESETENQSNQGYACQPSSPQPPLEEDIAVEEMVQETLCKCENCNQSFELTDGMRSNPCCPECGCFNGSWLNL